MVGILGAAATRVWLPGTGRLGLMALGRSFTVSMEYKEL